jgi:hypothetical protein
VDFVVVFMTSRNPFDRLIEEIGPYVSPERRAEIYRELEPEARRAAEARDCSE